LAAKNNLKFPHQEIICNDLAKEFCRKTNAKTTQQPWTLHTQPNHVLRKIITTNRDYLARLEIRPAVTYGAGRHVDLEQSDESSLTTGERKTLRKMFGPIKKWCVEDPHQSRVDESV
jgi:hypothetical protein